MLKYIIRTVRKYDYQMIAEIYNENHSFLLNHLGVELIDEAFVLKEILTMRKAGFCSCVIEDRESSMVWGVLDYRAGKEAYLSLLMLTANMQGRGMGSEIYSYFEEKMMRAGSETIRIDVVNDYQGHLAPFWKKHGFEENEKIALEWGNKRSSAIVMRKHLRQ